MIVRPALRGDLLGIGRVAQAAHWASYDGLLRPDTIGRLVSRVYAPSVIARRLLRGGLSVVVDGSEVIGFADGVIDVESIRVDAIAVAPEERRRGAGTALLRALGELDDGLPTSADVLLGNLEGEGFYEANGFVPGEVVHNTVFGEPVVERRWWREEMWQRRVDRHRATGY